MEEMDAETRRQYLAEFDRQHCLATMYFLSTLKQTSSVADLQEEFEDLIQGVTGISNPLLISYFISALRPEIQREMLRLRRPSTLVETFALARACEARVEKTPEIIIPTRQSIALPSISSPNPFPSPKITTPPPLTKSSPVPSTPSKTLSTPPPAPVSSDSLAPIVPPSIPPPSKPPIYTLPPEPIHHGTPSSSPKSPSIPPPPPCLLMQSSSSPTTPTPDPDGEPLKPIHIPILPSSAPFPDLFSLSKPPPDPPDPDLSDKRKDESGPEPDLNPNRKENSGYSLPPSSRPLPSFLNPISQGPHVVLIMLDSSPVAGYQNGVKMELGDVQFPLNMLIGWVGAKKVDDAWRMFDKMPYESLASKTAVSISSIVIKSGINSNYFVETALLDAYAKGGNVTDSYVVIAKMNNPTLISERCWSFGNLENHVVETCTTGNVVVIVGGFPRKKGREREDVIPKDIHIYKAQASVFEKYAAANCKVVEANKATKELEGMKMQGSESDVITHNILLSRWVKGKKMGNAGKVFDGMPHKSIVSFSTMIYGFASNDFYSESLQLVLDIHRTCIHRNHLVETVLVACATCGNKTDLYMMFAEWNGPSLVSSHGKRSAMVLHDLFGKPLLLLEQMQVCRAEPNSISLLNFSLNCTGYGSLEWCKSGHAYMIKVGLNSQVPVMNVFLEMCLSIGNFEMWTCFFSEMDDQDAISGMKMIGFYWDSGCAEEALDGFTEMRANGVEHDIVTLANVPNASAIAGVLRKGRYVHSKMPGRSSNIMELIPSDPAKRPREDHNIKSQYLHPLVMLTGVGSNIWVETLHLLSASDAISVLDHFKYARLYNVDQQELESLAIVGMEAMVGVENDQLISTGRSQAEATGWLNQARWTCPSTVMLKQAERLDQNGLSKRQNGLIKQAEALNCRDSNVTVLFRETKLTYIAGGNETLTANPITALVQLSSKPLRFLLNVYKIGGSGSVPFSQIVTGFFNGSALFVVETLMARPDVEHGDDPWLYKLYEFLEVGGTYHSIPQGQHDLQGICEILGVIDLQPQRTSLGITWRNLTSSILISTLRTRLVFKGWAMMRPQIRPPE